MNIQSHEEPHAESLLDTGEAVPLRRTSSARRQSLRAEARRRRVTANIVVVCSSVAVIAVAGICYALLLQ